MILESMFAVLELFWEWLTSNTIVTMLLLLFLMSLPLILIQKFLEHEPKKTARRFHREAYNAWEKTYQRERKAFFAHARAFPESDIWTCEYCGHQNPDVDLSCFNCGGKKPCS